MKMCFFKNFIMFYQQSMKEKRIINQRILIFQKKNVFILSSCLIILLDVSYRVMLW